MAKNSQNRGNDDSTKVLCRTAIRKFVSTRKAAEMLGYSTRSGSVNRLIEEGLIEAEQGPGHGLLVYVDSIEYYMKHHLSGPITRRGRPRADRSAPAGAGCSEPSRSAEGQESRARSRPFSDAR